MKGKARYIVVNILTNLSRMLLAATFLFSGFVKANDPLGTVYKLEDYFAAWGITGIPYLMVLSLTLLMVIVEFGLCVYLLFGMRRRIVSRLTVAFMTIMTLFTVYIAIFNPVSDCGCFGDAIILSNTQTLVKNIVLLACALIVARWYKMQQQLINRQVYWIVSTLAMLGILAYCIYCIYTQPVVDFRPYSVGTDLRRLVEVPAEQRPQFEVTIVYERDGETMEIGIDDDDPDSTWTYVETRRKEISKADKNIINDFYINDAAGDDVASDILSDPGYTMLLTAPVLHAADQSIMDRINNLYDLAQQTDELSFVALTAADADTRARWTDYTGAEYQFFIADERTLKTMVRANPGLMLLHDGVVIKKWSNWNFPDTEQINDIITQ